MMCDFLQNLISFLQACEFIPHTSVKVQSLQLESKYNIKYHYCLVIVAQVEDNWLFKRQ